MKSYFIIFPLFFFAYNLCAQVKIPMLSYEIKEKHNVYNSTGQKDGLWIDSISGSENIEVCCYKDGIKHGFSMFYRSNIYGKYFLSSLQNYKNGELTNPCMEFDERGICRSYIDQISTIAIEGKSKKKKAYSYDYNEYGVLDSEGWIVFWDNDCQSEVDEVGVWIIYKNGETIEKNYGNGNAGMHINSNKE